METVLEVDACATMWRYLRPLNYIFKNGEDGQFYVPCILPQLKIEIKNDKEKDTRKKALNDWHHSELITDTVGKDKVADWGGAEGQ